MSSLNRNLRSLLEKTVLKARELAEKGALEALTTLGVDQPKPFDHLTSEQRRLRNQLRARGRQLGDTLDKDSGRQELRHLIEVVAYEHWHRMLFARFLAENGLLLEPEHQVPVSLDDVEELARDAGVDVWELAGRYAQKMLPAVFRADDPVLALPLARETRVALEKLVGELPREVFLADDSLGWTYQFWQAQRKEEVNKSGAKIGADELSPVTQLFTEDYMVEFLLHNTLGAWWAGKLGPLAAASEEEARNKAGLPEREGLNIQWTYLRFVYDEKTQLWAPAAGTFPGWPPKAKDVTVLDPCMGSGHFLVFALPLLVRLRIQEEKLSCADAVTAVLRDNIYGLELDERCTQIAAFNLALAAWKLGGYQILPPLHLACSGLAPNATEKEWCALAAGNEKLERGMERLHRLFQKAAVLGSLINPRAFEGDLFVAAFHNLQPLLEKALEQEVKDESTFEMVVAARGLAKAAEILAGQFTLVATNVPYLGRSKQDEDLKKYCEDAHPNAKADLATCFIDRSLSFCAAGCSVALVAPQSWHFQSTFRKLREELLTDSQWSFVTRLGPKAFQTPMWDFNVLLTGITKRPPEIAHRIMGLDVSSVESAEGKSTALIDQPLAVISQSAQLKNPESRIVLTENGVSTLLSGFAETYKGLCSGDGSRFQRNFWEIDAVVNGWAFQQGSIDTTRDFAGREGIFFWQGGAGEFYRTVVERLGEGGVSAWIRGRPAWGRQGVAVRVMGNLPVTRYTGELYDNNVAVVVAKNTDQLPAIWAFCESDEFNIAVRQLNQKVSVTDESFVQIPFDLARWEKRAEEKYPQGLPKPFSSQPTQWLFNGHPAGADQPLHVAITRLLGYRWPRQTGSSFPDCPPLEPDSLEAHADADGIVCLSPVHGERAGADRLRALLSAALGDYDEHALIAATGSKARDLETWMRDEFFEQHCALFHHRPFVWHLWDGRKDGFHALVNYHQLAAPNGAGRKLLETLTYTYLGDWIRKQQDAMKRNEPGAEDRLIAAQALQKELEAILAGEPPYDLFVRWKPLHQQPIGWEPDLNDGVRLNIRPFMLAKDVGRKGAGILRAKPNIKWEKDRGGEPMRPKSEFPWFWGWDGEATDFAGGNNFDGNRWNACHYSIAVKRAAQEHFNLGDK